MLAGKLPKIFTRILQLSILLTYFVLPLFSFAAAQFLPVINQVPMSYYGKPLGVYDVNLNSTLTAIAKAPDLNTFPLSATPYYQRVFFDHHDERFKAVSEKLHSKKIYEFTVPLNSFNFFSLQGIGIRQATEKATGKSFKKREDLPFLRGTTRILTDSAKIYYVYTLDHYKTFSKTHNFPYPQKTYAMKRRRKEQRKEGTEQKSLKQKRRFNFIKKAG